MRNLWKITLYLEVGCVCLALFEGTQINWSSAWTYGWVLAWPIGLVLVLMKWVLIAAGLIVAVALAVIAVDRIRGR